jgi:hypothetical protein
LLSWLQEDWGSAKQRFTLLKTLLVKRDDHVMLTPLGNQQDGTGRA